MRILGIDPGSRNCGLAVIETSPLRLLAVGSIVLPGVGGEALRRWRIELDDWLAKWRPERISMESVFFNKNISSAVRVGEARGIVMLVGYEHGCEVVSYTPQQAKKALTGDGKADKAKVAAGFAVAGFIPTKNQHANDAVALAVCDAVLEGIIELDYSLVEESAVKIATDEPKYVPKTAKAVPKTTVASKTATKRTT